MKKNVKKVVAFAISLSVININMIQVRAEDKAKDFESVTKQLIVDGRGSIISGQFANSKPVITLDKVIKAAIDNSDELALKSKEIKLYRDKMKLQEKTNDFYESINQTVYDFPYDKLELQVKQVDQAKDFLEDQISNDITSKYNAIVLKQLDIDKAKVNLEIKNKELNTIKTKVNIGMGTANQLYDKTIEINSLENDLKAKEDSLKNNVDYLSVLTDLQLSTYTFDTNISYDIFKINGSLDEYFDDKINRFLKYNDKMLKLTKDYLDDLKEDGIKDILDEDIPQIPEKTKFVSADKDTGAVSFNSNGYALSLIDYLQKQQIYLKKLEGYGSYLDAKYNVDASKVKLEDTRKSLKNGLKEAYSTLLDLQNKIDTLNEQVKSTNTKLGYAKTQVDVGMMTEDNYKAQVLKSEDLDTSLRSLINTYNTLKNTIQKPWSSSSAN